MHHHVKYIVTFICLVCLASFWGYPNHNPDPAHYKKQGLKYYREGNYYSAIHNLIQYLETDSTDHKTQYKIAHAYRFTRNYFMADSFYSSAYRIKPDKYPKALFYNGKMLMNQEQYDQAIAQFADFRKIYKNKRDSRTLLRQARVLIEGCEKAKIKQADKGIKITHLNESINRPHLEFGPVPIDKSTFIFGSVRENEKNPTLTPKRQFYVATYQQGSWENKGLLEGPFNNPDFDTGNGAFSQDGQRFYFTRCRTNWQGKNICEIYVSHNENGNWSEPKKLDAPINLENYTTTHPAVGKDMQRGGDVLYFVSDRPGGKGKLDIWYTIYNVKKKNYRKPRNLGSKINTHGNDITPFYSQTRQNLYFSSDGHAGYGGYDIYEANGQMSRWDYINHLPSPINTSFDEFYFTKTDEKNGFFTSNRPGAKELAEGSCCDDIFQFSIISCTGIHVKGRVFNKVNKDIYDMLHQKFSFSFDTASSRSFARKNQVLLNQEYENGTKLYLTTETDNHGSYFMEVDENSSFELIIKNFGFFDKVIRFNTFGKTCPDTLDLGDTNIDYVPGAPMRFNIYYEHDKARITEAAKQTIDTTLLEVLDLFPNAIIEIGSHTDNTGSDNYNIRLSQKRSENVVKYLLSQGIAEERLVAQGYGETEPIAPNTHPDGSDNPEGRQMNRRTEIKIIGQIDNFVNN